MRKSVANKKWALDANIDQTVAHGFDISKVESWFARKLDLGLESNDVIRK